MLVYLILFALVVKRSSSAAVFPPVELSALQDLYNGTGGESWSWKSDQFGIPWNFSSNANPCIEDWQGIQCTLPPPFDTYHVADISLPKFQLSGLIPDSMGLLNYLQVLDFSDNLLTGSIPPSLLNLTRMEFLSLSTNMISGRIPDSLGYLMPNLTYLHLSENVLSGTIPVSVLSLSRLKVLSLRLNHISGSIPENLGYMMTSLTYLQLTFNRLVGTLPISLLNLTSLEFMALSYNRLDGTIPSRPGYVLPNLTYLELHYNLLVSIVPERLDSLFPVLTGLQLSYNLLTGTFPACLNHLNNLKTLDLSYNKFSGYLGGSLNASFQGQLQTLVLNDNVFTGSLPESYLQTANLQMLALDNNCFRGTICSSLCSNVNLEILTLGSLSGAKSCVVFAFQPLSGDSFVLKYRVYGQVPSCLFELPKLQRLALLGNALTGAIPSNITLSANLTTLLLSNNIFGGTIPANIQKLNLTTLDLSNNLFDGQFSGRDLYTASQAVDIRYNYLSGNIPTGVQTLRSVNILSGNLFACDEDRSDLPKADSAQPYYQCGSDDFNKPLYAWVGVVVMTLLGMFSLHFCREQIQCVDFRIFAAYARLWVISVRDTKLLEISKVRQAGKHITSVGIVCAACIICIGVPVYGILTKYYGTYTSQYAWTVSLVLLSGIPPFALGLLLLLLCHLIFTVAYTQLSRKYITSLHFACSVTAPTTVQVVIVCTVYVLANLIFPALANVYYLAIVVQSPAIFQVIMSVYKFVWNSIISPYLSRWLVQKLSKHRADFFTLELFVALMSNVIIPAACVGMVTPQCLYGIFGFDGGLEVSYEFQGILYSVDYAFPYRYQYLCSFTYMKYYASAFIYLSIFSAFGIPVYEMTLLFLYTRAAPGTYWCFLLRRYLPRILRPLETDPEKIPSRDIFRPYFDATKFFISQLTCLALILSLGVVSPPLAACLAVTMLVTSAYTVLKVGRFLTNATEANQPKYIELIDEESRGVVTLQALSRAFWLLLSFSCVFVALFLFDILVSTEKLYGAFWVLIVVPFYPLAAYIMVRIWRYVRSKYDPKAFDVNDVNSSVYAENGTGKAGENDNAVEMSTVVMSPLVDETCKL